MTFLVNRQLFAESYLRDLRTPQTPVDTADASRQTISEWREEYSALPDLGKLLSYLGYCFSALGFAYERNDDSAFFVLYGDESHTQPLGICLATTDEQIGRMTKGRHHQVQLIRLLRERQLAWGIVTNGHDWRLCYARASAPYEVFLQANLDAALDVRQLEAFVLFYHFFSRTAFEYTDSTQHLDVMLTASDKQTQAIERHLKGRVEEVLQSLCLGFVTDEGRSTYDREQLDEIYRNAIYLLYRVLFLLYAEARELLPINEPDYREHSLAAIVEDARDRELQGKKNDDPYALWKRLSRLCVVVDEGDENLGLRPYNGGLFSDAENPFLRTHKITDDYLSFALYGLAYLAGDGEPQLIDYRDLSVRHLGTLYEGMLEYRLNLVIAEPVVVRESKGKRVYIPQSAAGPIKRSETILNTGKAYFADDRGERKSSGSFYTPEDVVQYNVTNTLIPKLKECIAPLAAILEEARRERAVAVTEAERMRIERYTDQRVLEIVEKSILMLRVLDLAMGSAHFLVAAGQVMANFIVETLNATEWPNDAISTDPLVWKRRVVERCLYGVDLNPLSQELAKLALWLSSASEGKPLTFLDHHLKIGNSLYGAPLAHLSTLPGQEKPQGDDLFRAPFNETIQQVLGELGKITHLDSDRIEDVKFKGEANRAAQAFAQRLRDLANVWLATLFGLKNDNGEPISEAQYFALLQEVTSEHDPDTWEAHVAKNPLVLKAREIAQQKQNRFFHWELEFSDAVVGDVCQFDVIVANPPYVGTTANEVITQLYRTAKCGDLYAWMFEQALKVTGSTSTVGMIVPLSIMFSRQFKTLRGLILNSTGKTSFAAFDASRDGIFPPSGGGSRNGQRVSIVTHQMSKDERRVYATNMMRWYAEERPFLIPSLRFADVTDVANEKGIPKLGDPQLIEFYRRIIRFDRTIGTSMYVPKKNQQEPPLHYLYLSGSGRYFLTAMPKAMRNTGLNVIAFEDEWMRDLAVVVLNSNIFYWLWYVLGDGFHVTNDNAETMVLPNVQRGDEETTRLRDSLLNAAEDCVTYLIMRGERVKNYNFNKRMDILLDIDAWIVRQVAPDLQLPRDDFARHKSSSFMRQLDLSILTGSEDAESEE